MVEPKALEPKNILPGMKVWIPFNGTPWQGRVVSVFPGQRVIINLDEGGTVSVPFVYAHREDVVTLIANATYIAVTRYQNEITSVKDLLIFACTHTLAGENADEAARLAFQLKACALLGIDMNELFYN